MIDKRVLVAPATIGAGIGVLSAAAGRMRRSSPRLVTAGLIGGVVGWCVGAAWVLREPAAAAARAAMRKLNAARDLHWLEKHPITYG